VTWTLIALPIVDDDIRQATSYYQNVAPRQAERFLDNVETVFEDFAHHPYSSTPHPNGLRRHSVKAFPYSVWAYVDEKKRTVVIAGVVHDRRDPRLIDERAGNVRDGVVIRRTTGQDITSDMVAAALDDN